MNDKEIFLKRMLLYRLQYLIAGILSFAIWCGILILFHVKAEQTDEVWSLKVEETIFVCAPFIISSIYNTVTYFYSKYMARKFGIEMFADLDQDWLMEHQAFDCKVFGEYFSRLIQCRKIAGPYMLMVMIPSVLINMCFAFIVGILYWAGYEHYRNIYLDTAISYKLPRAFGGGGAIISKIIDHDFLNRK